MSETTDTGTQPAPSGETATTPAENTAADTGQQQTATETTEQQADTEPAPKPRPWFEKVIAERAYEAREAKRQAAEAIAYAQRVQAQFQPQDQQPATQPPPGYVPASEVGRIVAQQLEVARFNEACNDVADHGTATFGDFNDAVANFQLMGGPPPALLEAVTALGKEDGARVFYELGKHPDNAQRILSLSPARMAVEIAKMATRPAAPPPVSRAPSPISPINSAGRSSGNAEPGSDAEWRDWFVKNRRR